MQPILISGIGGDIGLGVARILRMWGWEGKLSGFDVHPNHPGRLFVDKCHVGPSAKEPQYLNWVEEKALNESAGLFIPTSEAEIHLLAEKGLDSIGRATILRLDSETVLSSLDKNRCLEILAEKGIEVPRFGIVGASDPDEFPVIVKPRSGRGSRQVSRFDTIEEFTRLAQEGFVWQSFLSPESEEYTCAIFRSRRRQTRVLLMRRTLIRGSTGIGEVVENEAINGYITAIANSLDFRGSLNVQLRLTSQGPLVFEINPRLSSTLVFRDKMGFFDLRWWIQEALGKTATPAVPSTQGPRVGTLFYRGTAEYFEPMPAEAIEFEYLDHVAE